VEAIPDTKKEIEGISQAETDAESKPEITVSPPSVIEIFSETDVEQQPNIIPSNAPQDKYNRGTPLSSVLGLSKALKAGDFKLATNYLDMRNLPQDIAEEGGAELARKLLVIAERSFWFDVNSINNTPQGAQKDELPSYRDRITRLETADGNVDILMQRVPREDGQRIWMISNRTVAKIPRLYEQFGYGVIGDKLSRTFPHYEIMALQIWQWLMLFGIILIAYIISWVITSIANLFLRNFITSRTVRIQYFISKPVRFLFVILITRANFDTLGPSLTARALFEAKTLLILAVAWLLTGIADVLLGRLGDRLKAAGSQTAETLLRPAATALKIIIYIVAAIIWLDNMGFKVTTLLAGLGVGSVAVALAAQKSIENLIGAITMYTAQPVRVGDYCRLGDTSGTVEELGLRATTLRKLDRTLVTIPNSSFANNGIENISKRDKFLYKRTIRLCIDTSPDQLRYILVEIRKTLYSHAKVIQDPARVRFVDFGEHSLNIEIFAYIDIQDINNFLAIAEDINLYIMDIIAASGSRLAIPTQAIKISKSEKLDENRIQKVEMQVEQWRKNDELNIPEFSSQNRDNLKGTLSYPAKGSTVSKEK
ncbi:MAG: mechanosensitive ion channel family protein, partial [Thiohalomonadales bacterium]